METIEQGSEKSIKSRRQFLGTGIKLAAVSFFLNPFQKIFGSATHSMITNIGGALKRVGQWLLADKVILNLKSKVAHLPTERIFSDYQNIAKTNQKMIEVRGWESQIKSPIHFNKSKSGIMLEVLAFQKLIPGINNKSLEAATATIATAFTPIYKNKIGEQMNAYNFRLHDLLLQLLALNSNVPVGQKWDRFQASTGRLKFGIDFHMEKHKKKLPPRMNWLKTKTDFDKRVAYIIKNKKEYSGRLMSRVERYRMI